MLHKGSSTEDDMMIEINETTDRRTLELAAIFECDFDLDWIEQASDEQLRDRIIEWIEAGDECGGAA
jgi:hypothetical protein